MTDEPLTLEQAKARQASLVTAAERVRGEAQQIRDEAIRLSGYIDGLEAS